MGILLPIPIAAPLLDSPERAPQPSPGGAPPLPETERLPLRWSLERVTGGLAEISSPAPAAGLTAAARLICEAQERGEPAAWIAAGGSVFYAPDLHDSGVDLRALPVVRVGGTIAGARAAEHLLRSGAFGLVVLDLGRGRAIGSALPAAVQVRLAALCRRHRAALVLLARKPEGSPPLASMAMLRAEGTVCRIGFDRFTLRLQVLKDKRQGTGWSHEEEFRGPDGLC
jgi:recombination protein RecA